MTKRRRRTGFEFQLDRYVRRRHSLIMFPVSASTSNYLTTRHNRSFRVARHTSSHTPGRVSIGKWIDSGNVTHTMYTLVGRWWNRIKIISVISVLSLGWKNRFQSVWVSDFVRWFSFYDFHPKTLLLSFSFQIFRLQSFCSFNIVSFDCNIVNNKRNIVY